MFRIKRYANAVLVKPLNLLNSNLKKSTDTSSDFDSPRARNAYFKSKVLVLIGLVFLLTNILLTNLLIFNVENYNNFVNSSNKLDLYLDLNRKLFKSKGFLHQFKSIDTHFDYFSNYAKSMLQKNHIVSSDYPDSYKYIFNTTYAPAAYLSHLSRVYTRENDPEVFMDKSRVGFHWADWVDLSPALPFVNSYEEVLNNQFGGDPIKLQTAVHKICYDKLYDTRDSWMAPELYDLKISVWEQLQGIGICSAIFKYYYWPIPERISFETESKYFNVPVRSDRSVKPMGIEGLTKIHYGKNNVNSKEVSALVNGLDRNEVTDKLIEIAKSKNIIEPNHEILLKPTIKQDPQDFERPDFNELLKKYREIEYPSSEDKRYLNFLEYSKANVEHANRFYFTFPFIKADSTAELHHYTFPWIKQVISHEERIHVVHHLIRSWFKLAEQAGIISWFNYGNLIGWYFNSMNLPWDNDVDVQLSIKDMDKLGRNWNNTLVVEDPQMGDGLFWLQTNPFYMQQNDFQFIDARYIDTKTGIYIDISALWHDNTPPPGHLKLKEDEIAFRCKHNNWFGYNEIFPIRRTIYEGAQAYMVNDVVAILKKLYGEKPLSQTNEKNHNWQKDIGLWVPNEVCENNRVPPTEKRFDEDGQLTLFGACNNTELLDVWRHTKKAWALHQKEAELIKAGESTDELTAKSLPIFRFYDHSPYR